MTRVARHPSARRVSLGWAAAAMLAPCLLLITAGAARAQDNQPAVLPAGCTPQLPAPKHHPIDDTCGVKGDSPDSQPNHQAQNEVKNNLCATGAPEDETHASLAALQGKVDANGVQYDRANLPERTVFKDLGEGKVARIVAFVAKATYSNAVPRSDGTAGESVNCDRPGNENNDIHVVLAEARGNSECASVTAEVIPHLRPAAWTPTAITASNASKKPLRFTGQLFFDASHHPCKDGKSTDGPPRVSEWEIHPVYRIEVCTAASAAQCTIDDDSVWTPLKAARRAGHKTSKGKAARSKAPKPASPTPAPPAAPNR
jgi:hypothetical protein